MTTPTPATDNISTTDGDDTNVVVASEGTHKSFWGSTVAKLRGNGSSSSSGELLTDALPQVNVINPDLLNQYEVDTARRRVVRLSIAMVLLPVLLFILTVPVVMLAQNSLDNAVAEGDELSREVTRLAPVGQLNELVTSNQDQIDQALVEQVAFSTMMSRMRQASTDIVITEANVEIGSSSSGSPCGVTPDPFNLTDVKVGCAEFSGTTSNRNKVGAMLDKLTADGLFTAPYVRDTTTANGTVTFTGSVAITDKVFLNVPEDKSNADDAEPSSVPSPSVSGSSVPAP